ncbi:DUF5666 domain-containing protein [Hydrogenophaga sp. OTU3427]|uniref:DUF5666 domain-containing protein n=1 Tax=Hydrogenophaga sp. OTU3427 TaxID=3043856 RepID=UPI00313D3F27
MHTHTPTLRRWRLWSASALLAGSALLLSACGGGGAVIGGVGTGGTGAFSSGAISGFGSIIVNGVRYDDSAASVCDDSAADDNPCGKTNGALKLGMVVEVEGSDVATDASGQQTSNARSIVFRSEIKGPVAAIDTTAGSFTVLGQAVKVSAGTVFDTSLSAGLASLATGDLVEVYGFVDANGVYAATRIEREDSASVYKIRGKLSALNTTAKTFQIGAALIDYSAINFNFTLVNGQTIRVELSPTPNTLGQWVATRLSSATALGSAASAAATVEVEGLITAFTSATSFQVNGVPVDASAVSGLPAGLGVGVQVEVKGKLSSGVLLASKVQLEDGDDREFEVKGSIAALNTSAQTFEIRGVAIDYSSATFKDGTVANLSVDVRVEIKGRLNATGTVVLATEVEFKGLGDSGSSSYEVKGAISNLNTTAKTFVVRGVTVGYATATFEDGVEANLADGAVVEVKGTVGNGVLVATAVDFEDGSGTTAGSEYEVKGSISSLDTVTRRFVVDGVTVSYAAATFRDGVESGLAVGVVVEVKGTRAADGLVSATRVSFED